MIHIRTHWLLAGLLVACTGGEPTDSSDDPGDPAVVADVDGLILRKPFGFNGPMHILDPRTGATSGPVLATGAFGRVRGVAFSPDGLHIGVVTTGEIVIATLDNTGDRPTLEVVHDLNGHGTDTQMWPTFNGDGSLFIANGRVVDVQTGEVLFCPTDIANSVWASPDGRTVSLDCRDGNGSGVYRDGARIWPEGFSTGVDQFGDPWRFATHTPSQDGRWLYRAVTRFDETLSLNVEHGVATALRLPGSGLDQGASDAAFIDAAGRHLLFSEREGLGGDCVPEPIPPPSEGTAVDLMGGVMGTSDFIAKPVPFGPYGDLPDIVAAGLLMRLQGATPSGGAWLVGNPEHEVLITVTGEGADAVRTCALQFVGPGGFQWLRPDGGAPTSPANPDRVGPCDPIPDSRVHPFDKRDPLFTPVVNDAMVCGRRATDGTYLVGQERVEPLPHVAQVISTGRRVTAGWVRVPGLNDHLHAICTQRLDRPGDRFCFDDFDVDAEDGLLAWGGFAVPGATGFAGPAIYRASHRAARPGDRVVLFGAGLGTSGTLLLGDYEVPAAAITRWTDSRIELDLPPDAPTAPSAVRVEGGPDIMMPYLRREVIDWTPTHEVADRVVAPYGSVPVPITPAPPDDATLTFQEFIDGAVPQRVTEDGIVVDLPTTLEARDYEAIVTLGEEHHMVTLALDGTRGSPGQSWQRVDLGLGGFTRGRHGLLEVNGHLVFLSRPEPQVLSLEDESVATLTDGLEALDRPWSVGPYDPFRLTTDDRVQQLRDLLGGPPYLAADWLFRTKLSPSVLDARAASDAHAWVVHPDGDEALFVFANRDDRCSTGICATLSRVELTYGSGTTVTDAQPLTSGTPVLYVTRDGFHLVAGNSLLTLGLDDFRVDPTETMTAPYLHTALPTAWGWVAHDVRAAQVQVGTRADAAAGFTPLSIDGVGTIGTSRDGTVTLLGTASGEVWMLPPDDPTTPVSLGTIPGWDGDATSLSRSWITATEDGRVVWLVAGGNPAVHYQRMLPE